MAHYSFDNGCYANKGSQRLPLTPVGTTAVLAGAGVSSAGVAQSVNVSGVVLTGSNHLATPVGTHLGLESVSITAWVLPILDNAVVSQTLISKWNDPTGRASETKAE